jgi:hypothetical protein
MAPTSDLKIATPDSDLKLVTSSFVVFDKGGVPGVGEIVFPQGFS